MTRFRCIGGACEASCCTGGWGILVDAPHYHKLKHAMDGNAADRARFRESVRRDKSPESSPSRYALMVLDDKGDCRFLEKEGSCSVHRRFGEGTLSDTCAIYPRVISQANDRLEVAGTLSCPEVARQLYGHDDSTAIDDLDPTTVRQQVGQLVPVDSGEPYEEHLDDVRATVVGLLETPGYPLSSRLFFVGWFAEQTRAAFKRGGGEAGRAALVQAIERVSDPATLEKWHQTVAAAESSSPRGGWVLVTALKELVERRGSFGPLRDFVRTCFAALGGEVNDAETLKLDPSAMFHRLLARRAVLDGPHIDALLTRFAVDYWLKEFYTGSADLAVHARQLVLRIALLRFLLFSHPRHEEIGPTAALVEATYLVARAMDHDPEGKKNLQQLHERLELTSLAHSTFLMKV